LIGLLLPAVQRSVNGDGRGLIGLLRGGIGGPDRAGYNGDGNFNGDGRSQLSAKIFAKIDGGGFDKQGEAGLNYSKQGNAGMDDWERGGSVGAQGEAAAAVDMFHKADSASAAGGNTWSQKGEASLNYSKQGDAGFQDLHQKAGGGSFDKDAKAGYLKQDGTSMGDGSVHNMDSQFQKGSDAGITDGSSFTGNG